MTTARPPGYPAEYEREVVLADGRTAFLRPVVPSDVTQLESAIRTADPETIRRRFLGGSPPHTAEALLRLTTVDYVRRFALAAFDPSGKGIGIARYEGEHTWPAVDLAVAVDPPWRGIGLARELLTAVVRRAAEQGATSLTADFYADNQRILDLIAEAGLPEWRCVDHGIVQDELALDPGVLARLRGSG